MSSLQCLADGSLELGNERNLSVALQEHRGDILKRIESGQSSVEDRVAVSVGRGSKDFFRNTVNVPILDVCWPDPTSRDEGIADVWAECHDSVPGQIVVGC